MTADDTWARPAVVLVTRPMDPPDSPQRPGVAEVLREVASHTLGLVTFTATTSAAIAGQVTSAIVDPILDAIVPRITDAILQRLDLTEIVLTRVDLEAIITRALDELNLTDLVLERVDINTLVAAADIGAVIDRVPIVPIANYVIDEIDLPEIIRESTGGIAVDAVNAVRVQTFGADQWFARIVDTVVRRRARDVNAPGDPESLSAQALQDEQREQEHLAQESAAADQGPRPADSAGAS